MTPLAFRVDATCMQLQQDVDDYVTGTFQALPITDRRLSEVRRAQQEDEDCRRAVEYTMSGWTTGNSSHPLYGVRDQLSVANGVLMYASRLVIPHQLRFQMLNRLHDDGHLGISKCRDRARSSIWWPNISTDLKEYLTSCQFCQTHSPVQRKEPLIPTPSPEKPWSHIASDIFQHDSHNYLVTIDIFSRFIEVQQLRRITSNDVIEKLKCLFARYGIPDIFTSDGGR